VRFCRPTPEEREKADAWREQIRDMHARMAELKQMEDAYGDAGTIAFILGIPVKDVLRVAGDREHDLEEIDPRDLTNTT
jgi:hypothetical protein